MYASEVSEDTVKEKRSTNGIRDESQVVGGEGQPDSPQIEHQEHASVSEERRLSQSHEGLQSRGKGESVKWKMRRMVRYSTMLSHFLSGSTDQTDI